MIRWLVAGYGNAGKCHVAAIGAADGAALAGIAAPEAVDAPRGVPVFRRLRDAIAQVAPDAVVVATPHHTHRELAVDVLRARIPLLCEKPVGCDARDAGAILREARATGVPAGVVLNQRACRHPGWIKVLADEGRLDRCIVSVQGSLGRVAGWHADPARAGGGLLRTIGIHYLDLLCWWFGPPSSVSGSLIGAPADTRVLLELRFAGGTSASISLSAVADAAKGPVAVRLESETGRIILHGHEVVASDGFPAPPPPERTSAALRYGPGHAAVIREATRSLMEGLGFPVPLAEVMPLLELVDALYAAASHRSAFTLGSGTPAEMHRDGAAC